ncbi:MAG: PHP domain-containing protein [Clostridia bacterium]
MAKIEMHVHSTFSDGCASPKEILDRAIQNGITHLSITDHDDIKGSIELLSYATLPEYKDKINLISGVELSVKDKNGVKVHILAYGFDTNDEQFIDKFKIISEKRLVTSLKVYNAIKNNISPSDFEIVKAKLFELSQKGLLTKDDAYNILMDANISFSKQKNIINALIDKNANEKAVPMEIFSRIFSEEISSGKMILSVAHPSLYKYDIERKFKDKSYETFEKSFEFLKEKGVKYIEAFHQIESNENVNKNLEIAKKYGFGISGGVTDAHNLSNKLGKRNDGTVLQYCDILDKLLPMEKVEALKNEIGLEKEQKYSILIDEEEKKNFIEKKIVADAIRKQNFAMNEENEKLSVQEKNKENTIIELFKTVSKIQDIKNGKSNLPSFVQQSIIKSEDKVIEKMKSYKYNVNSILKLISSYKEKEKSLTKETYDKIAKAVYSKAKLCVNQ